MCWESLGVLERHSISTSKLNFRKLGVTGNRVETGKFHDSNNKKLHLKKPQTFQWLI